MSLSFKNRSEFAYCENDTYIGLRMKTTCCLVRKLVCLKMKFVDQTFNSFKGYDDDTLKNNKAKNLRDVYLFLC